MGTLQRVLFVVALGSARLAAADCARPEPFTEQKAEVVVLGTYADFFGHLASFFATEKGVVYGLDHQGPVPKLVPGSKGIVTARLRGDASDGFFVRFEKTGEGSLEALLPKLSPLAIGLLAGRSPVQDAAALALPRPAEERVRSLPELELGILYAASADRAATLLAPYPYRTLLGSPPPLLVALTKGSLSELAQVKVDARSSWVDTLPALAHTYLARPKTFRADLVNLLFGADLYTPQPLDEAPLNPMGCAAEVRSAGPFERVGDVGNHTLINVLKRKDPAFAKAIIDGFRGLNSIDKGVVVDHGDGTLALVMRNGGFELITSPTRLPLYAQVKYVARIDAKAKAVRATHHLRGLELGAASSVERIEVGTIDAAAGQAALMQLISRGGLEHSTGIAISLLDADPATRAPLWLELTRLPKQTHDVARATDAAARTLAAALRMSQRCELVRESLEQLPALILTFARREKTDADALRKFLFNGLGPGVLLCLARNDLETARRAATVMSSDLSTLLPKDTTLTPETDTKYTESRVLLFQDLVNAVEGQSADPRSNRAFQASLFLGFTRTEEPNDVAVWSAALKRQGYPLP